MSLPAREGRIKLRLFIAMNYLISVIDKEGPALRKIILAPSLHVIDTCQ